MITCSECCYFWYSEEYGRETCMYNDPMFFTPCEVEDDYEEDVGES